MTHTGVVLTGGGARAAYQVGVLRAISDMYPGSGYPFDVVVGTSAGAINAAALAGGGGIFRHNVSQLENIWANLSVDQVYHAGSFAIMRNMSRVARKLISGGEQRHSLSLLNNEPLRRLLEKELDFDAIHQTIEQGHLRALGLNACGYTTGRNLCFFEGSTDVTSWSNGQRAGSRTELTLDHVMASSAIPTLFEPVHINREYFGDGVTRQIAHISPAIRLGAEKVVIIGVSGNSQTEPKRPEHPAVPTFGQIMSHVFNGLFLDTLDYDIERLDLINQLVELIPQEALTGAGLDLKPIELLDISPSQPLEDIAEQYMDGLPTILRTLAGVPEDGNVSGASLGSYLLFDHRFCRDLIELGYKDAQAQSDEIAQFFGSGNL
ncbi:patatin-like phospholipase family protein [Halospina sp. K52047b]|uniref:patatin-like phospholipase family protein n=1 Tax=Halospina sp. K52047b TaxID=2614160 RepID=UPI00124ABBAA|nr:patatin-like phospholipase family protein [Halospina sp. K52047b]KAA8979305.1 patatin-like phospholipase family protein [Halospina sp. K52047b]